jgi:hypothetical protein
MRERPGFVETWRALLANRRALPIAGVAGMLLAAEWRASHAWVALLVDAALLGLFFLLAPACWRRAAWLASSDPPRAWAGYLGYLFLATAAIAAVVGLLGLAGLTSTYVVDRGALGLLVVLFGVGGWGLGRDIDLELGIEAAAVEAERARLLALRAQLDPHFLFNTLNAIAEWCREEPRLAEQATLKLASILRTILDGVDVAMWPLSRELELVRAVTELWAMRDPERYRFELDVVSPLPLVSVPPMILLPLIENAITHGPAAGHAGIVHVTITRDTVTIDNPGAFAGRREGGRGIAMVERRLALAYGEPNIVVVRAANDRTLATMELPEP